MKIGFDVSQTGREKAGCGFWAENLIHELSTLDKNNEYLLYPTFGDHYWDNHYKNTCRIDQPNFHQGLTHSSSAKAKQFWQNTLLSIEEKLGQVNILHTNNFFCPPKLKTTKIVYTLYDLSFIETPDCTTEHNRIACFNGVFQASINADFIISISDYTRNHFLKIFPHYPTEKIVTVHPGCRFNENKKLKKPTKLNLLQPQQFWLNVGTIEPRKNIKRLLAAYAAVLQAHPQKYPLVLAGKMGWLENDIKNTIDSMELTEQVHILGYVSDQELTWLYQNCFCLTYPSLFEGFGLPILEAMKYGAPIITSNTSSLPEVVDKAGIIINPYDHDELFRAMLNILTSTSLREELKLRSIKRAEYFSWKKTAQKILGLYENIHLLSQYNLLLSPNKG